MADDVQNEARSVVPDESPGARLRAARVARDLTTREIAKKLHVDSWMLDAIERDEFSALGAPVFAKGHLRKYALELGVDPDDLMVAYYQLAGTRETPPLIAESILRMEADTGTGLGWLVPAAIVFAAVASVAAGAMWYLRSDAVPRPASAAVVAEPDAAGQDNDTAERSTTTLALPSAAAGNPPPVTVGIASEPAQTPSIDAEPVAEPEPEPTNEAPEPLAVAAAPPPRDSAPVVEPAAPPAPVALAADDRVTLTLRFRAESWVEVYDRDRNKLLYGMGDADSVQYMSGPPPIRVFLGRYRDVDVEVNGDPFEIPRESRRTNTARFVVDKPGTR